MCFRKPSRWNGAAFGTLGFTVSSPMIDLADWKYGFHLHVAEVSVASGELGSVVSKCVIGHVLLMDVISKVMWHRTVGGGQQGLVILADQHINSGSFMQVRIDEEATPLQQSACNNPKDSLVQRCCIWFIGLGSVKANLRSNRRKTVDSSSRSTRKFGWNHSSSIISWIDLFAEQISLQACQQRTM